ncbi:uncharacterized protein LOC132268343 [Cornus florida]|uniref:uncharacterized protein LOC132268343 n=1 Tax=Cornus florida TaxID=4283 RepID=UPI00289F3738|nr:uncharacterized protein LOC132268343 [Cornus florida]
MGKKLVTVFLMCIVVFAAAMHVAKAAGDDHYHAVMDAATAPATIDPTPVVASGDCFSSCKKECGSPDTCLRKCRNQCAENEDKMSVDEEE